MHRRKMKDQKEIIIFKQFCQTQTHLSWTWRGKQSVVIIKKACTCFFNKYFMICHLLPREAITHHSHCILSSCGMTKTELIMLRSYEFRIEGSESWQAMSRAMNLELQELALSACYAPGIPVGLIHRGIFVQSSKKTLLWQEEHFRGFQKWVNQSQWGPESCLSPSLRELNSLSACLDLFECGQFVNLPEIKI